VLADYVMEIAGAEPYVCGTAGYVASFNEWEKPSAFSVFHRWSKRFLGLDLEDPDSFGWAATDGLITTSWLTLIGEPLLERFESARLLQHRRFRDNVEVIGLRTGLLVRAGSEPSLGDVNRLQFPHTYSEVARALEPLLSPRLPEMVGTFYGTEETAKWQRRLIAPEEWA
jgi:hypothetical protein